jgi:aminobenzoyl-glutamate transport protein
MTTNDVSPPRRTLLDRFLSRIERVGNALPHPATLFLILTGLVVFLSWLLSRLNLTAIHPKDGSIIEPVNLVSRPGLHWILDTTVENFASFAPLATVLVALLGIGVAERSGLIATILRLLVHAAPRRLLRA